MRTNKTTLCALYLCTFLMICRTVFSTEEVTTTKNNASASNCDPVPTQIKSESK